MSHSNVGDILRIIDREPTPFKASDQHYRHQVHVWNDPPICTAHYVPTLLTCNLCTVGLDLAYDPDATQALRTHHTSSPIIRAAIQRSIQPGIGWKPVTDSQGVVWTPCFLFTPSEVHFKLEGVHRNAIFWLITAHVDASIEMVSLHPNPRDLS